MDWTVKGVSEANHNPDVVVNGTTGKAPVSMDATVGTQVAIDATGTRDPDGDALRYNWFFYPEAGTGIPGQPVVTERPGRATAIDAGAGGIPPAGEGGPPQPPARVTLEGATSVRVTVTPRVAGMAHIILAVEDAGTPALTSYRRVILTIRPR